MCPLQKQHAYTRMVRIFGRAFAEPTKSYGAVGMTFRSNPRIGGVLLHADDVAGAGGTFRADCFNAAERSRGSAVVVIEFSAETILTLDGSCVGEMNGIGLNQPVFES